MSKDGEVIAKNNRIEFRGGYRPPDFKYFCSHLSQLSKSTSDVLVLDFREVTDAFPNTMLPTIAYVSKLRKAGIKFATILPSNPKTNQRFISTNWAHFLSPNQYKLSDDITEPHLVTHNFTNFHDHFRISKSTIDLIMKTIQITRSSLNAFEWIINELMDNVVNHANTSIGGFAQMAVFPNTRKINFCVTDPGRGLLSSLKEAFPALESDRIAIQESVKSGITRDKSVGQGNGLSGSLMFAIKTKGLLRILVTVHPIPTNSGVCDSCR